MSMFEWVFHAIAVNIIIIIIMYVGGGSGSSSRTAVSYSHLDLALCKMYDEKWSTKLNVAIKLRAQSLDALFRIPSSAENSTLYAPSKLGCSLKVINKPKKKATIPMICNDEIRFIATHFWPFRVYNWKYSWPHWKRVMCAVNRMNGAKVTRIIPKLQCCRIFTNLPIQMLRLLSLIVVKNNNVLLWSVFGAHRHSASKYSLCMCVRACVLLAFHSCFVDLFHFIFATNFPVCCFHCATCCLHSKNYVYFLDCLRKDALILHIIFVSFRFVCVWRLCIVHCCHRNHNSTTIFIGLFE